MRNVERRHEMSWSCRMRGRTIFSLGNDKTQKAQNTAPSSNGLLSTIYICKLRIPSRGREYGAKSGNDILEASDQDFTILLLWQAVSLNLLMKQRFRRWCIIKYSVSFYHNLEVRICKWSNGEEWKWFGDKVIACNKRRRIAKNC